ncbi:Transmembrane domain-containing protein [Brazilian cedratvirus IHUMI]|uniref:Transmembrane domain-containing protein n=1 Tax=Brazilian cedratvirus IHUMI TaxID=2126980 RepID=A0A2R8FDI5_9VIRU|nr:Transmembrane domain-containing protein [Brazilian cedratvirus IHUMI]
MSSTTQVWVILGLSVLTIILLTIVVYLGRRRALCYIPLNPWCWTDWTCPGEPEGSETRCPVLPTQNRVQSCLPTADNPGPNCPYAWNV